MTAHAKAGEMFKEKKEELARLRDKERGLEGQITAAEDFRTSAATLYRNAFNEETVADGFQAAVDDQANKRIQPAKRQLQAVNKRQREAGQEKSILVQKLKESQEEYARLQSERDGVQNKARRVETLAQELVSLMEEV